MLAADLPVAHRSRQGCAPFAHRDSGCGLYREDEHPRIGLEKMARCLFLSIFSSREYGFGVVNALAV